MKDENALGDWGNDNLQVNTVYVRTEDALLGLQYDKPVADIFVYFKCENIELISAGR